MSDRHQARSSLYANTQLRAHRFGMQKNLKWQNKNLQIVKGNTYVVTFLIDEISLNNSIWFQNKSFIGDYDKIGQ